MVYLLDETDRVNVDDCPLIWFIQSIENNSGVPYNVHNGVQYKRDEQMYM